MRGALAIVVEDFILFYFILFFQKEPSDWPITNIFGTWGTPPT
jgi:hypothetical protein